MGRTLKRVPLDFDWPQGKVWPGYMVNFEGLIEDYNTSLPYEEIHHLELKFACLMGYKIEHEGEEESAQYVKYGFLEPPMGAGYQLWETTSEGSPQSPVFASLDELCEWCAENATTFASYKASAEEWKQMFDDDMVYHQQGNAIFL